MSNYDDRLKSLREHAADADLAIRDLPEDAWAGKELREHFLGVMAYARVVLEASDGALLSDKAFTEIDNTISRFESDPAQVPPNADPWSSELIDAVALLPAARDREVEQAVKDAAANFQRSAQHRLNALNNNFDATKAEIVALTDSIAERTAELTSAIDGRKSEIEAEIAPLQTAFEARLTEFEEQIEAERTALAGLRSTQTTSFEEAEDQRNTAAKERLSKSDAELTALQERATTDVEQRVANIRRMETESAQLVGAIGLAGTAERYGEEVKDQKGVANLWRWITIATGLGAVGAVVFALAEKHPATETFTGKLALSLILGGIATYTARQSANHRRREERARDLQLELTAFAPFIEPLSAEQQEEERVIMTRKTFGKTNAAEQQAEEPGPTPLSFVLRRKEQED